MFRSFLPMLPSDEPYSIPRGCTILVKLAWKGLSLSIFGLSALMLTGTNFSISAAVGLISIFGVAIMDGL